MRSPKEKDRRTAGKIKPSESSDVLQNDDVKIANANKVLFENESRQSNQGALVDARSEVNSSSRRATNRRSGSATREFSDTNYDRGDTRTPENECEDMKKHQQTAFLNEMQNSEQSNFAEHPAVDATQNHDVAEVITSFETATQTTEAKKRTSRNSSDEVSEYVSYFSGDTTDTDLSDVGKSKKAEHPEESPEPSGGRYSQRRKSKRKERKGKLHERSDKKATDEPQFRFEHDRAQRLQTDSLRSAAVNGNIDPRNDSQKRKLRNEGFVSVEPGSSTENSAPNTEIFDSTKPPATRTSEPISANDGAVADANSPPSKPSALREVQATAIATDSAVRGHKQTHSRDSRIQLDKPSKLQFDDTPPPVNGGKNTAHANISQGNDTANPFPSGDFVRGDNLAGQNQAGDSPATPANISPLQATADKKAAKAQKKANRSAAKLEKAEAKLPKKHRLKYDKTIDPESKTPKPMRKLHFEGEVKNQADHVRGSAPSRPLKSGANAAVAYGHKKIYMVERENVGTEAAHKGELAIEGALRRAYRRHKTKPYRRVEKLSRKNAKMNARAAYRKSVAENPRLQKSFTSRMLQKRKIQRQYAKAAREGKKVGGIVRRTANRVANATKFLVRAVTKNPKVLAVIGAFFLLFALISAMFSACAGIATGVGESIVATSFLSESAHIDDASIAYSEMETELLVRLENIAYEFPGFDEYRIDAGSVGHCPFQLMAFLTATHPGFTYPEIRTILQELFDAQYQLTTSSVVEIRHYLNEYDELVPYEWNVLYVTLTARPFSEVINENMSEFQQQHFSVLLLSGGNRQYVGSPFPFDWTPFISSHYGWRIHPISGEAAFHAGIDIGLPTGTEILAAHDGVVTFAGVSGGYGNFIIIEAADGTITRYAHCDTILVSVGQEVLRGDVIGTVGSTGDSTGPHLHFEIIRDGRFLNPAFFAQRGGV